MNRTPDIAEEPLNSGDRCADLYLRLRPVGEQGRIELRPHLGKVALVCSVSGSAAIICLAGWLIYPWSDHPYDVQMKWIALLLGIVFFALTVWFSTAFWRFKRSARALSYDSKERLLEWCDGGERHEWKLDDVLGLQLIHHQAILSQLNLVVREQDETVRILIHQDLCHRIHRLVGDFVHWTGLEVISEVRPDTKDENNARESPTTRNSAE